MADVLDGLRHWCSVRDSIGPAFSSDPLYVLETPIPYPLLLLHVVHCFWDGGLFMLGILLVRKPYFARLRIQELAVELASTGSSGWAFVPHRWNPSMFEFRGSDIKLVPQLV